MRHFLIPQGFDPYKNLKMKGSCPKKLGSGNDHGCHDRRSLPDVYFLAGFQGEKDNIVYFSAGSEAFKYTSQRSGAFMALDPQEEKHPVPEENVFRGFDPYRKPLPKQKRTPLKESV